MDLNALAKEIHQNAVDHGWWDNKRPFCEIIDLCHSELSEVLEEYRNGRELNKIYYSNGNKPEGIPIKLVDEIIRILDYLEHQGVDIQQVVNEFEPWIPKEINKTNTLPKFIAGCHWLLSEAYWHKTISKLDRDLFSQRMLIHVILTIQKFCQKNNIDLEKAIQIKYEYNKNRPCRHGNKVI